MVPQVAKDVGDSFRQLFGGTPLSCLSGSGWPIHEMRGAGASGASAGVTVVKVQLVQVLVRAAGEGRRYR